MVQETLETTDEDIRLQEIIHTAMMHTEPVIMTGLDYRFDTGSYGITTALEAATAILERNKPDNHHLDFDLKSERTEIFRIRTALTRASNQRTFR